MNHRLIPAAVVSLLIASGACAQEAEPATQPATQPATLELLKAQERQAIEQRNEDEPSIGPFAINQVVRLGLKDNRLIATTDLPTDDRDRRVIVSDDRSYWRAAVRGDPAGDQSPLFFMVEKYDFLDPQCVFSHAQVLAAPGQIQVVGEWQYQDGALHVTLLDSVGAVDVDDGIVTPGSTTLFVNGYDAEGGRNVNVRLRAADLKTLRREHPREISAYLRPVLRQLQADELVAIDAELAWQVLGSERKPNPDVARRVQEILPRLDADSFAERERAAQALRDLGVEGALVMLQLDRSTLTPEQNARVEEVIAAYHQAAVKDVSKLAEDLDFLLDVLLTEEPELRAMALERIRRKVERPIEFDIDATLRQRADRVAQLRTELLPPPATQAVDPTY